MMSMIRDYSEVVNFDRSVFNGNSSLRLHCFGIFVGAPMLLLDSSGSEKRCAGKILMIFISSTA